MGITQQRLIDQNNAARDYEQALTELIRRIHIQLSQHPSSLPLQILASITPSALLNHPTESPALLARESENIRLTRSHNERRRKTSLSLGFEQSSNPSENIPDLIDPIEERGRAIMDSLGIGADKPPQPLKED